MCKPMAAQMNDMLLGLSQSVSQASQPFPPPPPPH